MPATRTILCPSDFSETADRALEVALTWAKDLQAEVHLIHVYQLLIYASEAGSALAPVDVLSTIPKQLEARLEKLREAHAGSGVTIHTKLIEDVPYSGIADYADKIGAYMIVIGTHGRSGFKRLLIGSVAERVVRLARCPVLTVPPTAAERKAS